MASFGCCSISFKVSEQDALLLVELDHRVPLLPLHEPFAFELKRAHLLLPSVLFQQTLQPLFKLNGLSCDFIEQSGLSDWIFIAYISEHNLLTELEIL